MGSRWSFVYVMRISYLIYSFVLFLPKQTKNLVKMCIFIKIWLHCHTMFTIDDVENKDRLQDVKNSYIVCMYSYKRTAHKG